MVSTEETNREESDWGECREELFKLREYKQAEAPWGDLSAEPWIIKAGVVPNPGKEHHWQEDEHVQRSWGRKISFWSKEEQCDWQCGKGSAIGKHLYKGGCLDGEKREVSAKGDAIIHVSCTFSNYSVLIHSAQASQSQVSQKETYFPLVFLTLLSIITFFTIWFPIMLPVYFLSSSTKM